MQFLPTPRVRWCFAPLSPFFFFFWLLLVHWIDIDLRLPTQHWAALRSAWRQAEMVVVGVRRVLLQLLRLRRRQHQARLRGHGRRGLLLRLLLPGLQILFVEVPGFLVFIALSIMVLRPPLTPCFLSTKYQHGMVFLGRRRWNLHGTYHEACVCNNALFINTRFFFIKPTR